MELEVFYWLNSWNGQYATLNAVIYLSQQTIVKAVPFVLVFLVSLVLG